MLSIFSSQWLRQNLRTQRFTGMVSLLVVLVLLLGGCEFQDAADNLVEPTIVDTTQDWTGSVERAFTALVNVPSAWQIEDVYVRYTRHYWPGPQQAHEGVAALVPGTADTYRFSPPEGSAFSQPDSVFYQWFIDYSLKAGSSTQTASARAEKLVVGCSQQDIDLELALEQANILAKYSTPSPTTVLNLQGYAIFPHSLVSLLDTGVAIANVVAGFTPLEPTPGQPELLLYAPRPRAEGESEAQYQAIITDHLPDAPYTLVGWAYGTVYDPQHRPRIGCIPTDRWFVHEAGYHTTDGGMVLTPPQETTPGEQNMLLPPPDVPAGAWHPRIWDLHVWTQPGAPPVLSIFSPAPIPGFVLPENIFFYSQVFE